MVQSPTSSAHGPIFQGTVVGQASPEQECLPAGMVNKFHPYLPINSPGVSAKQLGYGPTGFNTCFDVPAAVVCTPSAKTAIRRNLSTETSLSVASPVSSAYPTYTGTVLKAVPIAEEFRMQQKGVITDVSVVPPLVVETSAQEVRREESAPEALPEKIQSVGQKSNNVSFEQKDKKSPLEHQLSDIMLPPLDFIDCLDDILSPLDSDCEQMHYFSIDDHEYMAREESCDLQAIFDSFAHENGDNGETDDKCLWSMRALPPAPAPAAVPVSAPVMATVTATATGVDDPMNRRPKRRAVCASGSKQEPTTPEQRLPVRRPSCDLKPQVPAPTLLRSETPSDTIQASNPFKSDGCSAVTCTYLFTKVLTMSDVGKLGRIILPRAAAEAHFPVCTDREGMYMNLYTVSGREYTCILKFWLNGRPNPKRMWLLDGCGDLVTDCSLCHGAALDFYASEDGRYVSVVIYMSVSYASSFCTLYLTIIECMVIFIFCLCVCVAGRIIPQVIKSLTPLLDLDSSIALRRTLLTTGRYPLPLRA